MGRRIYRLLNTQISAEALKPVQGQDVEVILKDGSTYVGTLRSIEATRLLLEAPQATWYNRKKHRHWLPLNQVQEVSFSPWEAW